MAFGPSTSPETGDSVTEDIEQDDIDAGSAFRFPGEPLKTWFDAKRRLNEETGLKLNFSYQTLWRLIDWGPDSILLIGRDGGWIGGAGAEVCYEALVWSNGRILTLGPPPETQ